MDRDTYDKINDYCTNGYKGMLVQTERDYILRKFLDSYYEAVQKFENNNGKKPNSVEVQTIISSLLNESTLLSYTESAKSYYEKFNQSIENNFERKQKKSNFWKSVEASVFANFIYSLILILIFYVAKDQIATWLLQLSTQ